MMRHHIYLVATLCFILGEVLHALAQLNQMSQTVKQPIWICAKNNWVTLTVRSFISLFLFLGLLEGQLDNIVDSMHLQLPSWATTLLDLNVNSGWIAGLAGYVFDSALGYIPGISKVGVPPPIVPAVEPTQPPKVN